MVAGAEFGYDVPEVAKKLQVFSDIFLRMIKTIIAPLLFSTLVVGIAGHANIKQIGRMGWKSLLYFEIVSTLALFIGLLAINIGKAGVGVVLPPNPEVPPITTIKAQTASDFILHIFPENIAKAIFEGQILQIVIFSIIFGIAVAMVKEKYRTPMIRFSESLSEIMFKFTNIVMYYAPVAVFAAIAYTVGHMGLDILYNLFKLLATLYVALILFPGICSSSCCIDFQNTCQTIYQGCLRTGHYRICNIKLRICFAIGNGINGEVRDTEKNCGFRYTYRLQFQSRWHNIISFTGINFCGTGCWY